MNILYISATGMTEPLGESQVLQYLLLLAKNHKIHLISFEKTSDTNILEQMNQRLKAANIGWTVFNYSTRFGVLTTAWQIFLAVKAALKIAKRQAIEIIHVRSFVPAVMGMIVKKRYSLKLLFDIRGFAIEEKIVDGRLRRNSWLTKFLFYLENKIYQQSDHIVTLTHVSKPIIANNYKRLDNDITVIPTCANNNLFKPLSKEDKNSLRKQLGYKEDDLILLHSGSLNNWVDFEAELKLAQAIITLSHNTKLAIVNKDQHDLVMAYLTKYPAVKKVSQLFTANLSEMNIFLNLADLGIFFIKPCFAKQASAPTKFAEMIAAHLYSVTNRHYGDMDYYLTEYPLGCLFELEQIHEDPTSAAKKILAFYNHPRNDAQTFSALFQQHFTTTLAIKRYNKIYEGLSVNC